MSSKLHNRRIKILKILEYFKSDNGTTNTNSGTAGDIIYYKPDMYKRFDVLCVFDGHTVDETSKKKIPPTLSFICKECIARNEGLFKMAKKDLPKSLVKEIKYMHVNLHIYTYINYFYVIRSLVTTFGKYIIRDTPDKIYDPNNFTILTVKNIPSTVLIQTRHEVILQNIQLCNFLLEDNKLFLECMVWNDKDYYNHRCYGNVIVNLSDTFINIT